MIGGYDGLKFKLVILAYFLAGYDTLFRWPIEIIFFIDEMPLYSTVTLKLYGFALS